MSTPRYATGQLGIARISSTQPMTFEVLESRMPLNADFGFIDTRDGFAFHIRGTDFQENAKTPAEPDNILIWTDQTSFAINFAVEWVDDRGSWGSAIGSVRAGDIADEARDRGRTVADFEGIFVKAGRGDDLLHADGRATFGIRTGAPAFSSTINAAGRPLLGQRLVVGGNSGNDTVFGSSANDILQGGSGSDLLIGLGGNDVLIGDMGDDFLFGGDGDDELQGRGGQDVIFGQRGNDLISGDDGDDLMIGGEGDDRIDGGADNDDLVGDELFPNSPVVGSDSLRGGPGDDSLLGDNSDFNPSGGQGIDVFQAGPSTIGLGDGGDIGFHIVNDDIERIDTTGADPGEPSLRDGNRFEQPGPFSGNVELLAGLTMVKSLAGIPNPDDPFRPGPFGEFKLKDTVV